MYFDPPSKGRVKAKYNSSTTIYSKYLAMTCKCQRKVNIRYSFLISGWSIPADRRGIQKSLKVI